MKAREAGETFLGLVIVVSILALVAWVFVGDGYSSDTKGEESASNTNTAVTVDNKQEESGDTIEVIGWHWVEPIKYSDPQDDSCGIGSGLDTAAESRLIILKSDGEWAIARYRTNGDGVGTRCEDGVEILISHEVIEEIKQDNARILNYETERKRIIKKLRNLP